MTTYTPRMQPFASLFSLFARLNRQLPARAGATVPHWIDYLNSKSS